MKTKKAYNEAILRAHQNTDEENQAQENLLHLNQDSQSINQEQTQLHESPTNLMKSWKNLRDLDQNLADQETDNTDK
jgi:hypothetical protein